MSHTQDQPQESIGVLGWQSSQQTKPLSVALIHRVNTGLPLEESQRLRRGLAEKQKLRMMYGLTEKQFRNMFERAKRKQGVTGEVFLTMLETAG